jgi:hypothetical protein
MIERFPIWIRINSMSISIYFLIGSNRIGSIDECGEFSNLATAFAAATTPNDQKRIYAPYPIASMAITSQQTSLFNQKPIQKKLKLKLVSCFDRVCLPACLSACLPRSYLRSIVGSLNSIRACFSYLTDKQTHTHTHIQIDSLAIMLLL